MREKDSEINDGISYFRQGGGCLEITQSPRSIGDGTGEPEMIHLCDPEKVLAEISQFLHDNPPLF